MSYLGTTKIGKMFLGSVEIAKAYLGTALVFQKGGNLPYTPVEYIETDGTAYIDTGIKGNDPRSCELKYMPGSVGTSLQCILGCETTSEDTNLYVLAYISSSSRIGFGHRYFYTDASLSITAGVFFEARTKMKNSSQQISIKRDGDSNFTSLSKTQSSTLTTGANMFIFAGHNPSTDAAVHKCPSGSRLYYCKIYSDNSFTTLVFDGIPCYYNGEFGLWDRVSDSFKGNANSTGAFTGPSIS